MKENINYLSNNDTGTSEEYKKELKKIYQLLQTNVQLSKTLALYGITPETIQTSIDSLACAGHTTSLKGYISNVLTYNLDDSLVKATLQTYCGLYYDSGHFITQ